VSLEDAVVSVDEHHFGQAMRCLLCNAIKFTPAGGAVSVKVSVDSSNVRVDVTDTGVGMSAVSQYRTLLYKGYGT